MSYRKTPLPKGWHRIRAGVARDAGYHCEQCGNPAPLKGAGSICDHITAAAQGGSDDRSNLRWLCKQCGQAKDRVDARQGYDAKLRRRPMNQGHPGLQ